MVPVAAGIVAHRGRQRCGAREQLLQRLSRQRRVRRHRLVERIDIGLMMLVVMQRHRLGIDHRRQRAGRIG
jgi:hypothetical protein